MQLVILVFIAGALWALFMEGQANCKHLPWGWIILWSALGGAANAEISLMFHQIQGGRVWYYFMAGLVLVVTTAAGCKLAYANNTPGFLWRMGPIDLLYAMISGLLLAVLVLGFSWVGGGFNDAYELLITVIRSSSHPWGTILLASFQAGIVEEVLYRLFALNLILYLVRRTVPNSSSDAALWISAIVSAVLFGMIPTHAFLPSLIVGLLLALLYLKKGLGHVIVAHIVGNVVLLPWNVFLS